MAPQADLSQKLLRKGTTLPSPDHPQRLLLIHKVKPAACLEAWFESGLQKVQKVGGFVVEGALPLPCEYEGCENGSALVISKESGVRMWPIRLDVDPGHDGSKPWTVYHYMNKHQFDKFVKLFHRMEVVHNLHNVLQMVMHEFHIDFTERHSKPTFLNPRGDPELCIVEPGKFKTKNEILKILYTGEDRIGYSEQGNSWGEFADYCVAVRVPGSATLPLGGDGAVGALNKNLVKLDRDVIEIGIRKADAKREEAKQKAEAEKKRLDAQKAAMETKPTGWTSFFFGNSAPPEYWDEEVTRKKEKPAGVCDREKREVNNRAKDISNTWTKEHFAGVHRKKEHADAKKSEEDKQKASRVAAEVAREKAAETATQKKKPLATVKVTVAEDPRSPKTPKTAKEKADAKAAAEDKKESDTLALYRDYNAAQKEEREEATGALNRMKLRRVVAVAKLGKAANDSSGMGARRLSQSKEGIQPTGGPSVRVSQSEGGLRDSSKEAPANLPPAKPPAGDDGLPAEPSPVGSPAGSPVNSRPSSPAARGSSALRTAMQARQAATASITNDEVAPAVVSEVSTYPSGN